MCQKTLIFTMHVVFSRQISRVFFFLLISFQDNDFLKINSFLLIELDVATFTD